MKNRTLHRRTRRPDRISLRRSERDYGSFDCASGAVSGQPLAPDAYVVTAITEWIATHEGCARFRRKRDRNGDFHIVLNASIPERCTP